MDKYTAAEEAYKNGYEKGLKDAIRHGHWVWWGDEKGYHCSVCNSGCLVYYDGDWGPSDYCPHCGAKMDQEGD